MVLKRLSTVLYSAVLLLLSEANDPQAGEKTKPQIVSISDQSVEIHDFPIFEDITVPSETYIELSTVTEAKWEAAWPNELRLDVKNRKPISILFNCSVKFLSDKSVLHSISFCFNTSGISINNCKSVRKSTDDMYVNNIRINLSFSPRTGGHALITEAPYDKELTSNFSCEVTNGRNTIKSNRICIYDFRRFYPPVNSPNMNSMEVVIPKSGSFQLPCSNSSFKELVKLAPNQKFTYDWKICSGGREIDCEKSESIFSLRSFDSWPAQVLTDGRLFLPFVPEDLGRQLSGKKLVCYVDDVPATYFEKPIKFSNFTAPPLTKLRITFPTAPKTRINLLNSTKFKIKLSCLFEVGKGNVSLTWTRKKQSSSRVENEKIDDPAVSIDNSNRQLIFDGEKGFSSTTEGIYTCHITWTSETENQTAEASYEVLLQYFPVISPLPVVYVPAGKDGRLECKFENPFPDLPKSDNWVTPSIIINDVPLDLASEDAFKISASSINEQLSKYMIPLDLTVTPINPTSNSVLQYVSKNMRSENSLTELSSSHIVTCVGENTLGKVRRNTVLQVVAEPLLVIKYENINNINCPPPCQNQYKKILTCHIENDDFFDNHRQQSTVRQSWRIYNLNSKEMRKTKKFIHEYINVTDTYVEVAIFGKNEVPITTVLNAKAAFECEATFEYSNLNVSPPHPPMARVFFQVKVQSKTIKELADPILAIQEEATRRKTLGVASTILWSACLAVFLVLVVITAGTLIRQFGKRPRSLGSFTDFSDSLFLSEDTVRGRISQLARSSSSRNRAFPRPGGGSMWRFFFNK